MDAFFQNRFANWVLAPAVVLCALIWVTWGYFQHEYPTCTFRYKLTAEVQTPEGVKTASGIWQVSYGHSVDMGGGPQPRNTIVGDALFLDLGMGKNLFITFTRAKSGRDSPIAGGPWLSNQAARSGAANVFGIPLRVLNEHWSFGSEPELCAAIMQKGTGKTYDVPFDWLPTLVTFSDLKDPNTSTVIQPDKLADSFGEGYNLNSVKISLSNEPITQDLDQVLPWLSAMKEKWSKGHTQYAVEPLVDELNYDAFRGPSTNPNGGAAL
jgi:hypothetical protein